MVYDDAYEKIVRPFPIDPLENPSQHPVLFHSNLIYMRENHCLPPFHPHTIGTVFRSHEPFAL